MPLSALLPNERLQLRSTARFNRSAVPFPRRTSSSSVGGQRCWAQLNRQSARQHDEPT